MTTSNTTPLTAHERVAHLTGKVTAAYALVGSTRAAHQDAVETHRKVSLELASAEREIALLTQQEAKS